MSDSKAKMHQIRLRLGLRPRPRWGTLQRSPRPLSCIKGGLLLREGKGGRGRGKGRERRGKEKEGKGNWRTQLLGRSAATDGECGNGRRGRERRGPGGLIPHFQVPSAVLCVSFNILPSYSIVTAVPCNDFQYIMLLNCSFTVHTQNKLPRWTVYMHEMYGCACVSNHRLLGRV